MIIEEKLLIAKFDDKNHRAEKFVGIKSENHINLKIRRKSAEKLFVVF
jgi:hypothetical protein